ncbi:rapid alkalinization factor [Plenodomus tracheiphilus IPT5]|uniref:Rapid alkalinization factor n=1 Tax=Plenodomus tracheiphilus IPT5 TaxID=1408161 RepID=A0A6A7ASN0_9PLEO|nr:rapid alkalinization factor [Plenodomus tracheiphilus IPT5]
MKFTTPLALLLCASFTSATALPQKNVISYDALNRNRVPCSQRGSSAANCKPGAEANPYTRGCSKIDRCRGGSRK